MDVAILQFFETIRTPVLTAILGAFSLLGEAAVLAGIVILVFWLAPRRVGEQALVAVLSGYCLNSFIKYKVARPRPYVDGAVQKLDPPLSAALDEYASFPSGHTQMTTGFFATLAERSKDVFAWISCAIIILLVAVARMYFGVHYPTDVLAGLGLGLVIAALWALVYRFFYSTRYFFMLGFALLALLPLPFRPAHDYVQAAGLFAGAATALTLLHFTATHSRANFPRRLWRIPVGIALLAATFAFTLFFPEGDAFSLIRWFLLAFIGVLGQLVFERLQI